MSYESEIYRLIQDDAEYYWHRAGIGCSCFGMGGVAFTFVLNDPNYYPTPKFDASTGRQLPEKGSVLKACILKDIQAQQDLNRKVFGLQMFPASP